MEIDSHKVALGGLRVVGASLDHKGAKDCLDFSAKHNIIPKTKNFTLDQFPEMVEKMRRLEVGAGRMVVVF